MKTILFRTVKHFVFAFFGLTFLTLTSSAQTLTTDQTDYLPGSTCTFTGNGFAPNEVVVLMVHNITTPVCYNGLCCPFPINTDGNGDFTFQWTVCQCPNDSLHATATGQSSSLFAEAFFTDGATDIFRSIATGDWNSLSTWEYQVNGAGPFIPAIFTPTAANTASTITIRNGHTVTVTASVTADQVVVESGGQLTINSGVTLTIAAGAGVDLAVNGILNVNGNISIATSAEIVINGTGTVNTGGSVFGTNNVLLTVGSTGQLTVYSTGNGTVGSLGQTWGVNIADGNGGAILRVDGTMTIDGATVRNEHSNSLSVFGTISILNSGNLTSTRGNSGSVGEVHSEGLVSLADNSTWSLGTGTMTVEDSGTVDLGPNVIVSGSGEIAVASAANLKIGSADGITHTTTTGNIRTGGPDTYSTSANYTYNGTAAQITGAALPTTVNSLTINNTSGAVTPTNDSASTGTLSVLAGATFQKIGTFTLIIGAGGVSNSGTITLNGNTAACPETDLITIQSSVNGAQRSWSGGGVFNLTDVSVKDQAGSALITVLSGTDAGNNGSNWNIVSGCTACVAPSFTVCPLDIIDNTAAGTCALAVAYTATAAGTSPVVTYAFTGATTGSGSGTGSGSTFNEGTTAVAITATNSCGSATCNFNITINDNTTPSAVCQNITLFLDANGQASIVSPVNFYDYSCDRQTLSFSNVSQSFTASSTGNITTVAAGIGFLNSPSSYGTTISAGGNTVNYGTLGYSPRNVVPYSLCALGNNMAYTTLPTPFYVTTGQTVTISFTGSSGEMHYEGGQLRIFVSGSSVPAIDNGSNDACGIASITASPTDFDCSDIGLNTVTLTVTDINGNTSTCTAAVTVNDNLDPTVTCGGPINVNADGGLCTYASSQLTAPSASDNCSVSTVVASPSTLVLGPNNVTWTATDVNGNTGVCVQVVTVLDNQNPTITCPSTVNAFTNSGCTATGVSLGTPSTADNCSVAGTTNDAPASYPLGNTTVTWTVTDGAGNTATCTQTVSIADNVAPTITCPSTVNATTNSGCTATGVSLGTPSTADNCSVANTTNDAPASYPLGNTTVTWTVTDGAGNTATCTQTVSVTDNVAPTITCPSTVNATTNSGCTATGVSLGTPSTADNCSVSGTTNDAPASYPLGNTTVTWTVTDGAGNTATCTQTVSVTDNVAPTITCPGTVNATTNSGCTATGVSLGTPTTADNCSVASTTNNAPASYPLGNTTVTWTVTDGAGNTATCTQTVSVTDNIAPTITCPATVNANTNSGCTATGVSLGTPSTADNCSIANTTNDAPASYPLGNTTVTWTVTDGAGNTATCTQTVSVTDNVAPTITCPAAVNANTNSGCTATGVSLGTPSTTDNCSVSGTTNDAPASYPLGNTTVTWTVTDGSGNTATCTQTVSVTDNVAPTITCPSTVNAFTNSGCTATGVSLGTPSTADNCSVSGTTNDAPASYPLGNTTVTWTVTDGSGNTATCTQTVSVADNVNPTITCPANITVSNDLGQCGATVSYSTPSASDNCSSATTGLESGLASGAFFPVGTTTNVYSAIDAAGNTATCSFTVTVNDTEAPTITCPANITAAVNTAGCAATVNYTVSKGDNCSGSTILQTEGLASGSAFPKGTTTNTFVVTDASGNTATCSFTVTVTSTLAVNAGADEQTYYGYNADQTVTRTIAATGGGGSYSYSWTLSRPLMCNILNSTGDEAFSGGSCTNNACPSSGSPANPPSCSNTNGSVNVKLIEDAEVCVTVTDAFGCTATDCFYIDAIDARCFSGNSSVVKVKVCHRTGSNNNQWVQLCISQDAVAAHLGANSQDYIGTCGSRLDNSTYSGEIGMNVYPNPAQNQMTVEFDSPANTTYQIAIFDITGRMVINNNGFATEGGNKVTLPIHDITPGVYNIRLTADDKSSSVRLVVTK